MIKIVSFSYKMGAPMRYLDKDDALEIDCRHIANPHHIPQLKPLNGQDPKVQDYVKANGGDVLLRYGIKAATRDLGYTIICFGCYGGKHRSVALTELLGKELKAKGLDVELEHLAL